jgi:hypothetical protein
MTMFKFDWKERPSPTSPFFEGYMGRIKMFTITYSQTANLWMLWTELPSIIPTRTHPIATGELSEMKARAAEELNKWFQAAGIIFRGTVVRDVGGW